VDLDGLGHVNNATYLSYFEMARAGYHAALTGHPFGTGPDADRLTFVIAEARIAYRVVSEGGPLGPARLIADGATVQVMYDLKASRVTRVPAGLLTAIEAFEGRAIPRSRPGADGG
jgi:acyl-CoA thioesterase FadM